MSDSLKDKQMTAKLLTHPFDTRSVMLFASIAFTSAMAQAAAPSVNTVNTITSTTQTSRVVQVERNLLPTDPRRHQQRQPVKKNM